MELGGSRSTLVPFSIVPRDPANLFVVAIGETFDLNSRFFKQYFQTFLLLNRLVRHLNVPP